jgi:release factor glutamine methyltransferase
MNEAAATHDQALSAAAALGLERLDAQLLLLHALGRLQAERAWLLAHDGKALTPAQHAGYLQLCSRRLAGEPLAYLVGHKEFFGLDLFVDKRVLVPRPDTETLVQWALELVLSRTQPSLIDLGTGSGAIALAIKKSRPDAHVEATDIDGDALEVARWNARRLSLDVSFRQAAWLAGIDELYDLILSNPPYIAEGDPHLPSLSYEPVTALVAGTDGLADLQAIVSQARGHLRPGGWLLLEHGWDQAEAVRLLLRNAGFGGLATRRDLAGIERCSGAKWSELG